MTEFFPGFDAMDEKGFDSIDTPGGEDWTRFDITVETPTGDKAPFSKRTFTPDLKSEVAHSKTGCLARKPLETNGRRRAGNSPVTNRTTDTLRISEGSPVLSTPAENPVMGIPITDSPRWDAFAHRVTWFLRSLSAARRAEIARRPRFRRLPWIRLASQPDDDFLP